MAVLALMFALLALYPAEEKPEKWTGVDTGISPTADHPAQQVSWYDSVMYCNWLSQKEGRKPCYERTGTWKKAWRVIGGANGYRLLREVEWEYACRAGTKTEYSMGNDEMLLSSYCQMNSNLSSPCGTKLPNGWGLHDVHGNVWEWCENRALRGGSWLRVAAYCRTAKRSTGTPENRTPYCGFRLALSPSVLQPEAKHNE